MLTATVNYFETHLALSRANVSGDVTNLFSTLLAIEFTLAGLYLALGSSLPAKEVARKILKIGFLLFIIQNYNYLLGVLVDGFVYLGLKTGTSTLATTTNILKDPDSIVLAGLNLTKPLFGQLSGLSLLTGFGHSLIVTLTALILVIAYMIIALAVAVTYIEFNVLSSAILVLLPFCVLKPTSFIGEKGLGMLVSLGIKLMCLAIIVAMCMDMTATISIPDDANWTQLLVTWPAAFAMISLAYVIPSMAANLAAGTPSSMGGLQFVSAAPAGAASLGSGVASAAGGVMSAAKIGARTIGGAVSGAKSANTTMAGSQAGTKAAATALGALGGAAGQAMGSLGNKAKAGYDTLKNHFNKGQQRASQTKNFGDKVSGKMKTFMGKNAA